MTGAHVRRNESRPPHASHVGTSNLLPINHSHDASLTLSCPCREPSITAFLASLEQVSVSVRCLCHPLGVRVARGTIVTLEVGIEHVVYLPIEPFLHTIIFRSWTVMVARVPLTAAFLRCAVEVVLGRQLHPHGIVTTETTVGG